jgi:hypothetical protein
MVGGPSGEAVPVLGDANSASRSGSYPQPHAGHRLVRAPGLFGNRDDVQAWIDAYVDAWRSYDPEAIGDLFSEGATHLRLPPLRPR